MLARLLKVACHLHTAQPPVPPTVFDVPMDLPAAALQGVHVGHALAAAHPSHRDASRVQGPRAAAEVGSYGGDHLGKRMITWSHKELQKVTNMSIIRSLLSF